MIVKMETECDKHGWTRALPVIDGTVRPGEQSGTATTYVCVKCLAESMVNPIRRAA